MTAEEGRLEEARAGAKHWRRWGPYVSERQWGTVREDYSADGAAWEYLTHDQARSRAYRWGEDGIAGISDEDQLLCFALALWNGADPILKERMFGLTGNEGNHGEDVKEYYFYLDNVPSHAYMKFLYKYPQRAFPYADLVEENRRRTRQDPEYELLDTGIFEDDRYFDVFVEYAKAAPEDILIRVSVANRGPESATLHVLPTLWFMNDWTWFPGTEKPQIKVEHSDGDGLVLKATHRTLGPYWLYCEPSQEALFTENETNTERLFGVRNATPFVKDAFHESVVHGRREAVNPARVGTKAAVHYVRRVGAGETAVIRLRLTNARDLGQAFAKSFDELFDLRRREADAFYQRVTPFALPDDMRRVQRQAFAGMLWSKQYYRFMVRHWLARRSRGSTAARGAPARPRSRMVASRRGRRHVDPRQVGIPVVRRLGHGVSLRHPGDDRSGFRQGAAAAPHPRVVHASERANPRLRMGVRRRQSAGARLGGDPRLPDRREDVRAQGSRVSRASVPEAPDQLHVVGQPQGCRRQQHLRGRLSGPRQHRRVRPHRRAACRRTARAGRRNQLDGHVLLEPSRHRARACQGGRRLRGHRDQVLRALRLHRRRGQPRRRASGAGCGTRRSASTSTSSSCPTGAASRSRRRPSRDWCRFSPSRSATAIRCKVSATSPSDFAGSGAIVRISWRTWPT